MSPCAIKHKSVIIYPYDLLITIKDFVLKNKIHDGGLGIFKGGHMEEKYRPEYGNYRKLSYQCEERLVEKIEIIILS